MSAREAAQPSLFGAETYRELADSGTGSQIKPSLRRQISELRGDCCGHQRQDHRGGECRICLILGREKPRHDFS